MNIDAVASLPESIGSADTMLGWQDGVASVLLMALGFGLVTRWSRRQAPALRPLLQGAWAARGLAAIGLPLIYLLYFRHGDMLSNYQDGQAWQALLLEAPEAAWRFICPECYPEAFQQRFGFFLSDRYCDFIYQRVFYLAQLLTGNSILGTSLVFSGIGLAGQLYWLQGLRRCCRVPAWAMVVLLLLLPAACMWSGTAVREGLLAGSWGLLLGSLLRGAAGGWSAVRWATLAAGWLLTLLLRPEQALAFMPFLALGLGWRGLRHAGLGPRIRRSLAWGVAGLLLFLLAGALLRPPPLLQWLAGRTHAIRAYSAYKQRSVLDKPGVAYDLPAYRPNFRSVLAATPHGLVASLFRPFPWQVRSPLTALMALENLVFWGGLFYGAGYFRAVLRWRSLRERLAARPESLLWPLFALGFLALLGLSTYFYGNLMRYRLLPLQTLGTALMLLLPPPGPTGGAGQIAAHAGDAD